MKPSKNELKIIVMIRTFKRPVKPVDLVKKLGFVRDFYLRNAFHEMFRIMCKKGLMVNMGYGQYGLSDSNVTTKKVDKYDYARQGKWILDEVKFK